MNIITENIEIFGSHYDAELMQFDNNDKKKWWKLWKLWLKLRIGLVEYKSRAPNIPEGLSESAFCMIMGSSRKVDVKNKGPKSFDTYNLKTSRAEQIKACSVKNDLTSFGPKSEWDDLYFLDFYRDGALDGSFDIYFIDSDFLYSIPKVIKQQKEGKRPRLSLKKLIKEHNIQPIKANVRI